MRAWYEQLAPRDRLTLLIGALIAVPLLFYILVWGPLRRDIDTLETGVAVQRDTLSWMQSAAQEIVTLRAQGARTPPSSTGSLLSVVNNSAQRHQLAEAIQRMTPQGENAIELQLGGVPFDGLVRWLDELATRHGVAVTSLSLSRASGNGRVEVRLTLERAA